MRESLRLFAELTESYTVLDTETTGLPDELGFPGIVTLGLVRVEEGLEAESIEFKIKPYRKISLEAKNIHGISNEEANTFQPFDHQWPQIKPWLDGQLVVIHNKSFDWPIIESHLIRYQCEPPVPIDVFCSQKAAIKFASEEKIPMSTRGPSLDELSSYFGIESMRINGIHGAKVDAIQTALVIEQLRAKSKMSSW